MRKKNKRIVEFGDFQTPLTLARKACRLLARRQFQPAAIVEPTCGTGNFLVSALEHFPDAKEAVGLDINSDYVKAALLAARDRTESCKVRVICDNFFETDWPELLRKLPEPLLVVGNPPWVTNADLGTLGSSNLPAKSNFQKRAGLDAITGKSNFDISEWMFIHILKLLGGREATMAMLCKTAVARKVLLHAWTNSIRLSSVQLYLIDANRYFGASVDACFLVCRTSKSGGTHDCLVYDDLTTEEATQVIGYRDGQLVAEVALYSQWKHLQGEEIHKWRSGIKHDCSKVMELHKEGARYRNGLGEVVELEDDYVFPMLKGSNLANGNVAHPEHWMLVTQRAVGDDTITIQLKAPKTSRYLQEHALYLDRRASSIYKKRPRFSIFGVGPYSFAPWKVAISGFYKKLDFRVVGTHAGQPIMLDDTSNFIACQSKEEAEYLASLLNSEIAKTFFRAFIFWDAKRPITIDLLRRLDLRRLACELASEATLEGFLLTNSGAANKGKRDRYIQGQLFPDIALTSP
ncbi:MAG: N-6 DNA methylase [Phycisphaerae bacterium]|nr:N-6 DNA methylase [Phycisphaerae bacterium]